MQRVTGRGRGPCWLFYGLVLAVFAILVAAGINGSSIGMLYAQGENVSAPPAVDDPDLLLGQPRPIRSDEWSISTPLAVSQTVQSFPAQPWIGLTRTNPAFFSGIPTLDAALVAKPQSWGYLLLGAERGLSWAWWFPLALAACALFALLHRLTRNPWIATAGAVFGSLTPFVAWWNGTDLFTGYAALAAVAAVNGFLARSLLRRLAWGAVTGWAVAATVLLLYPPWTVSTGLVVAALVLGLLLDSRPAWRSWLPVVAGAGAVAALIVLPWFRQVAPVVEIINSTIYPGQRQSGPGEGVWQALLSAPANLVASVTGQGPAILNQSEVASSWLPMVVLLLLAVGALIGGRPAAPAGGLRVGRATVVALVAVLLLLLAWMLVPALPDAVGKVTLLSTVPGSRLPLALGLTLVLLAAALSTFDVGRMPGWLRAVLIGTGVTASIIGTTYAAHVVYPGMSRKGLLVTAIGAGLVAAAFASMATRTWVRVLLPLGAAYAMVSFAVVNPVYLGLGPLTHDPVSLYAREVASAEPDPVAVTLGGRELQALVRGGGMQVLSWTTLYPDRRFWEKALPGEEEVWNNYRNYGWYYDPAADPIRARITALDAAELAVDLCDPLIRDLGYSRVFSAQPISASCLAQDRILQRGEQRVFVYTPR